MTIRETAAAALAESDAAERLSDAAAVTELGERAKAMVAGLTGVEPTYVDVRFEAGRAAVKVEDLTFWFLARSNIVVLEAPEDDERTGLIAYAERPDIPLALRSPADVGFALERGVSGPDIDIDPTEARADRIAASVQWRHDFMAAIGEAVANDLTFIVLALDGDDPTVVVWNPKA